MNMLGQSLLLLCLVSAGSALFVFRFGRCPRVPVKQNFDLNRYLGVWWEYQRFPAPFEFSSVCGYANYTLLTPSKIRVVNTGYQRIQPFGIQLSNKQIEAVGEAAIVDPAEPAKLQVSFGGMPAGDGKANYFLVDTDYDNYAVVFSCSGDRFGFGNIQFAWILTRGRGVRPDNLLQIRSNLRRYGVDTSPFFTVDQTNC